ncbi:MAG TPA: 3-octaprenyl-4-hydroxybenzoate carboxy-lyase [Planctomycetaceae bacterium]|jgi:4-hydroxy-3-polyprenylbenzoate decarboxylase|nr:3-octaprenyl-4-hydroxybenzoate carboxy-lyase [Planctomycetaceae bacterium]|tara:strand:- start:2651 stop:3277 length:627 start_codon:yes stop_codon:yes gene_type:complete
MSSDLVLAITGASGSIYGTRLLETLLAAGRRVHLTISPAGAQVLAHELDRRVSLENFDPADLLGDEPSAGELVYHHHGDFTAGIASGSFLTAGMAICPCSMGTLAAIAGGNSGNLIHRAADVHLKERRRLVLVPRETPLGSIGIENMRSVATAGAVILPASPGFYHQPKTIADLVDFVVGRICDQLGVEVELTRRWGHPDAPSDTTVS